MRKRRRRCALSAQYKVPQAFVLRWQAERDTALSGARENHERYFTMNAPTQIPPRSFLRHLVAAWTWRMAWRESRSSRRRLLLFSSSIVLGVAALVAIGGLRASLEQGIAEQARTLLGADLAVSSRRAFTRIEEEFFKTTIGGEQAREVVFSSMIHFPKGDGTRLVQVRALGGNYPFYGQLESRPAAAAALLRNGSGVIVDDSVATQFGVALGDAVRIGELTTTLTGTLLKAPGETPAFATLAPRVYLPLADLARAKLLREGSLARYRVYFRFPAGTDVKKHLATITPRLAQFRLSHETVATRQQDLGESLNNLTHFLNLVGFVALLLGGVGIASAIHVHVKQKLASVAVLRCLGASVGQAFAVYVAQATALGVAGVLAGAVLGALVQHVLPRVLADFLPLQVSLAIHWGPLLQAMGVGLAICLLFALLPLLAVRRVSPLVVLRSGFAENAAKRRDPALWLVNGLIVLGVVAFAISQSQRWYHGLGIAAGLGLAFGALAAVAGLIAWGGRRLLRPSWPFVWRQGLANLYRPNNRTVMLMLSLGLGTFLILTLYLTHATLLRELFPEHGGSRPNAILFDVQPDQREAVAAMVRGLGLPLFDESPVVTMRLQTLKGQPVETLLNDAARTIPNWVLRREYRSTYRERLVDSETLTAGAWVSRASLDAAVVPVSLEAGIAKDLRVKLGDELEWDVQGLTVKTRVASLRKVDWRRVQANFFVVFPAGVLEGAPGFYIVTTRINSAAESARLQQAVVKQFPNVSTIDLTIVLQTLDGILGKVSFVLRFMAFFTVATGLLVLGGAVLTGRYQRIQESILLRTLGASRAQIRRILVVEYLLLGVFAGVTGVALALGASWALAAFVFKVGFAPALWPNVIAVALVSALTVVTGLATSWGIASHPPLEILRAEG